MITFEDRLTHLVKEGLLEDVGEGDHSSLSVIPGETRGKAVLKIKETGILAGVKVAQHIFRVTTAGDVIFTGNKQDGDFMQVGEIAFEVEAKVHHILQCERLV